MMVTQWNKGYNTIRSELKSDLQKLDGMYDAGYGQSHHTMCEFAWQMHIKAQVLPANDGGWIYVQRADELCHSKFRDDEREDARWVVW